MILRCTLSSSVVGPVGDGARGTALVQHPQLLVTLAVN